MMRYNQVVQQRGDTLQELNITGISKQMEKEKN